MLPTDSTLQTPESLAAKPRQIGHFNGTPGNVVICIGGLHGNEVSGVTAAENVLKSLHTYNVPMRGAFYALRGNLRALAQGKRYIDIDLNRVWTTENVELIRNDGLTTEHPAELFEMAELLKEIAAITAKHTPRTITLLDLHSTSGESMPFCIQSDHPRNLRLAGFLRTPVVLGIDEQLNGTFSSLMNEFGYPSTNFEGGQHTDPLTVTTHEGAIWTMLEQRGMLGENIIPGRQDATNLLLDRTKGFRRNYTNRHRFFIPEGASYTSIPGLKSFQKVKKGTLVGHCDDQPVLTPDSGFLFMPLYQKQGRDGYFLIQQITPWQVAWKGLSTWVARAGVILLIPGVRRCSGCHGFKLKNARHKRLLINWLRLLGYRREEWKNDDVCLCRRQMNKPAVIKL